MPKEHSGAVFGLALLDDLLVSGSLDKMVKMWSVSARACRATLREHTLDVIGVAVTEEAIATGSLDKTARIWPRDGGASRFTLLHPDWVFAVHIDGDTLATGCRDRVVRTWSVASGQLTRVLRGHGDSVYAVSLSGSVLVSGGKDERVRVWALGDDAGECVATCHHVEQGGSNVVPGVALSASGGFVASLGGGESGELIVWRPA